MIFTISNWKRVPPRQAEGLRPAYSYNVVNLNLIIYYLYFCIIIKINQMQIKSMLGLGEDA